MEKINEAGAAPRSPTEFVIDRSKWLRGEGGFASRLLREGDGKMCCLGFYGAACGYSRDELRGRMTPEGTLSLRPPVWPAWLVDADSRHSAYCEGLMSCNDSRVMAESEREQEIAAIFAKHGVTARFVDSAEDRPVDLGPAPGDSK